MIDLSRDALVTLRDSADSHRHPVHHLFRLVPGDSVAITQQEDGPSTTFLHVQANGTFTAERAPHGFALQGALPSSISSEPQERDSL